MLGESASKSRLEQKIWRHVERRYPLTRWWWGDELPKVDLFPEWSAAAFVHEADEWRRLAQESLDIDDPEALHWGRFGRIVANRIYGGSFRDAAEPLRYANLVLTMVTMLDSDASRFPRPDLLGNLRVWLTRVHDVSAGDLWRRVRTDMEATRLSRTILAWESRQATMEGTACRDEVQNYVDRVRDSHEDSDHDPWMASAHASLDFWRTRRTAMQKESPIVQGRPLSAREILEFPGQDVHVQEVVIPGMESWWLRPRPSIDVVIHGEKEDSTWALAIVLAYWRQQSSFGPLTWALTIPPIMEGGLMAAASWIGHDWSDWKPAQGRFFPRWLQHRRAMAMSDAWLWLEDGDVDETMRWLGRYVTKTEALALIPWMKSHPGYYVMGQHVYNVLHDMPDGDSWLWAKGPMMPDAVFLPETD